MERLDGGRSWINETFRGFLFPTNVPPVFFLPRIRDVERKPTPPSKDQIGTNVRADDGRDYILSLNQYKATRIIAFRLHDKCGHSHPRPPRSAPPPVG